VRDRGLIAAGLAAVLALVTLPIWYNAALGTPRAPVALARPAGERCVAPLAEMRASHMTLLVDWRERVVRHQQRRFVAADGTAHEISLTRTCLGCHGSKVKFCDTCHEQAGVRTACFDCHLDREGPAVGRIPAAAPAPVCGDAR
jgi:hypothetical protein